MKICNQLKQNHRRLAGFSLVELSIVIIVIAILIGLITGGSKMVYIARLTNARGLTKSSPVAGIDKLAMWLESTSKNSFDPGEAQDKALITTWHDINPQNTANNAVQNTTAGKPSYSADGMNHLPSIIFDGNLNCLISPLNINYQSTPKMTIFAVFKNLSIKPDSFNGLLGNCAGGCSGGGVGGRFVTLGGGEGYGPGFDDGAGIMPVSELGTVGQSQIITYASNSGAVNGSSFSINHNLTSNIYTDNFIDLHDDNFTIGSITNVCEPYSTANVSISEIIVFKSILKAREIAAVEDYLSLKWGIKLSQ